MKKMKLNKSLMKAAIFSSAMTLYPHLAYGANNQLDNVMRFPSNIIIGSIMVGGGTIMTYQSIMKEKKERLYNLHYSLIPGQIKIINYLINSSISLGKLSKSKEERLKVDIERERRYLRKLETEKKALCDSFNLDVTDENQIDAFLRKVEKKLVK